MAFPASPSDGDLHVEGRKHYSYLGGKWYDRMELALVADAAERLKLAYPRDVRTGTLCVQQDTGTTFRFQAPASISDKIKDANWIEVAKSPTATNELLRLTYDPEKAAGHRLDWEDDRDSLAVVPHRADLHLLPVSHLATGKLVYCTDDSTLYEFIGSPSVKTATMTDWAAVGVGIREYNRASDLPQESASVSVVEGELALVRFHLDGTTPLNRVFVARSVATSGRATIQWVSVNPEIAVNALASDADITDAYQNDIQVTTEAGHKIVKIYSNGAWIEVYKETDIKQWIAAGNLFVGTIEETGHGVAGAIEISAMPAESALGATDKGHYWTWVGKAGYTIVANDIGGATSSIEGNKVNVGDWVQVAEPTAGTYRYTVIPGDLLSKARGDSIYGLNDWVSGAYEQGSLVVRQGKIYRATQAVLVADGAPGTAGAPWGVVALSAGLRSVNLDSDLPASAALGDVYLVINSVRANGNPALYVYDTPTTQWRPVGNSGGGTGTAMSLSGGKTIHEVGVPIGSITMWATAAIPAGWLKADGQGFDPKLYPKLQSVLGSTVTPNLSGMFVRGAGVDGDLQTHKMWTTGIPAKLRLTAAGSHTHTTSTAGAHTHTINMAAENDQGSNLTTGNINWGQVMAGIKAGIGYHGNGSGLHSDGDHTHTLDTIADHTHTFTGGDAETAPTHVLLYYIIKATETIMETA